MGTVCNINKNLTDCSNLGLKSDRNPYNNLQIQSINDSSSFKPLMLSQKKMFLEDQLEDQISDMELKPSRNLRIEQQNTHTDINLTPKGILKNSNSNTPDQNRKNITSKFNSSKNKGDKYFKSQKKRKPRVTFEILDNLF